MTVSFLYARQETISESEKNAFQTYQHIIVHVHQALIKVTVSRDVWRFFFFCNWCALNQKNLVFVPNLSSSNWVETDAQHESEY